MSKDKLEINDADLLKAYEANEFNSVLTDERKEFLAKAADHTIKKDKRINIRISNRDLTAIQRRASEEGIPYQTLIASILHKYVSGGLVDVLANKHLKLDK
ncbi:CopG family antitoxin [Colwelliaceae bacterium BS250]